MIYFSLGVPLQDSLRILDSINVLSPDTIITVAQNQNWIPRIELLRIGAEILIAAGAIIAAVFAILSYKKSRQFRRAHVMLYHKMGNISITGPNVQVRSATGICIYLKNFGTNPAYNLKASLLLFNSSGRGLAKFIIYNHNPITEATVWKINLINKELGESGMVLSVMQQVKILILQIEYEDIVIKNKFSGKYYLAVNSDGSMTSPRASDVTVMKESENNVTWPIQSEF